MPLVKSLTDLRDVNTEDDGRCKGFMQAEGFAHLVETMLLTTSAVSKILETTIRKAANGKTPLSNVYPLSANNRKSNILSPIFRGSAVPTPMPTPIPQTLSIAPGRVINNVTKDIIFLQDSHTHLSSYSSTLEPRFLRFRLEQLTCLLLLLNEQIPTDPEVIAGMNRSSASYSFVKLAARVSVAKIDVMCRIYFDDLRRRRERSGGKRVGFAEDVEFNDGRKNKSSKTKNSNFSEQLQALSLQLCGSTASTTITKGAIVDEIRRSMVLPMSRTTLKRLQAFTSKLNDDSQSP